MTRLRVRVRVLVLWATALAMACSKHDDAAQRLRVEREMKDMLLASLRDFSRAAEDLRNSAPVTRARGWDARADAASLLAMKQAWQRGRVAYELVEGALAPSFLSRTRPRMPATTIFWACWVRRGTPTPSTIRASWVCMRSSASCGRT